MDGGRLHGEKSWGGSVRDSCRDVNFFVALTGETEASMTTRLPAGQLQAGWPVVREIVRWLPPARAGQICQEKAGA